MKPTFRRALADRRRDLRALVREMVAVLTRFEVPAEARRALLDALSTRKNRLG